jgi:hypothetical protein
MRRNLAALLLVSFTASLPGCYTAGVESPVQRGARHHDVGVSWFWGLTPTVADAQECRRGLAEVRTWLPWYAYIVAPLTLGIVTPMKKKWTCAD